MVSRLKVGRLLLGGDAAHIHSPGYEAKLTGMGSTELVRAMREGDWNVVEGAYFDCWSSFRHVLRPFAIPPHWMRFRSMD
jgi:hypothetical protein